MKIKVFVGKTLREAMQAVHAELSQDAVILECRRLPDGVEVMAALDYDMAVAARSAAQQQTLQQCLPFSSAQLPAISMPQPLLPAAAQREQDAEIAALRREVADLKALVHEQLAGLVWSASPGVPPHVARLFKLFSQLGLEENLARELLADLPATLDADRLQDLALRTLAERIPVLPAAVLEQEAGEQQVIALIGPAGVGKTTTLVKLAARHIQQFGAGSVTIIATDHYRIGAREQLAHYGRLLGVPVLPAADAQQLQEQLVASAECSLVLIDTAGMSPRDRLLASQLALLGPIARRLRTYLVLAANGQYAAYGDVISQFRAVPLAGVILTKLDEAAQLGPAFSALIRHELGLAWVANGQRVPEDLHHMQAAELLDRALALSMRTGDADERSPEHRLSAGSTHAPV